MCELNDTIQKAMETAPKGAIAVILDPAAPGCGLAIVQRERDPDGNASATMWACEEGGGGEEGHVPVWRETREIGHDSHAVHVIQLLLQAAVDGQLRG